MIDLLREYWDWFLFDTLVWTGVLIALVMILRRPVSRHFGAGAAYALWFLPLARMLIPPFTLPSWMRPLAPEVEAAGSGFVSQTDTMVTALTESAATPPVVFASADQHVDFLTPLLLLWLGGAAVMLVRRFWLYFELRRQLLEDAVPVGEVGSIRLIETPAISGPMAFGVIDRVVALPEGFMASRARKVRDLAIEHELSHHRGGDLVVNMAVQPLFAIHWFNPLGWLGWSALRRDQEAYCDARVVSARSPDERAAYAGVIADFARRPAIAPRPALAAPMACPVLGDKSIIHRLRSLSMSDISPRRRLTGRAAVASAFLAVPLTASFCFAEATAAPTPPPAPEAPLDWVMPVSAAPLAPPPPHAPPAPDVDQDLDAVTDIDREVRVEQEVIVDRDGDRRVVRRYRRDMTAEERAELEADLAEMQADLAEMSAESAMSRANMQREISISIAEAHADAAEARAEAMEAVAEARAEAAMAHEYLPKVVLRCKDKTNIVATEVDARGRTTMFVCEANANRIALPAVKTARKAVAADRNLTASERAEALRAIDKEISELKRQ